MATRTGNFAIGIRRLGSDWCKDTRSLCAWLKQNGFDAIDLHNDNPDDIKAVQAAGLRVGTVDLKNWWNLIDADPGKRKENIAVCVQSIKDAAALGVKLHFTVVRPVDPQKSVLENYKVAVETYAPVGEAAAAVGGAIVLEGWPGSGENLACNPETYRAFLKDVKGSAINFDPSHLIRMGIDHVRFIREFAPHVRHVHGKDTELFADALYELGNIQSSAFGKPHGWGSHVWRYTIPGHGCAQWVEIFRALKQANYSGVVSVELEDENFNGSEQGEKDGFVHSLNFLKSC
jgi:sugar phosphate isomerase/epimerase